ncbi:MAG: peptidoglycan recognition protein family protein [Melioribacteraceae bacterium]|nr:peptidoglycan recognition protein family protein [Melioribacteraceae bacterium]
MKYSILFIFIVIIATITSCKHTDQSHDQLTEIKYPKELGVMKRADWNWVPIDSAYATQDIKYITVHHGGVEFLKGTDPIKSIQNLQSWSRSEKKWIDIPYHYMIDLDGIIYEGRPINIPGDTNTEYNPLNHALIEVMGNYEIQVLSEIQLNSLIELIKFLMIKYNVPLDKIKTHKDYSSMTVCPGKDIYKYFESGYIEKALNK